MSDIYLQITETPTVVTLSAPVVSGALASTVTVANTVTVALDANSLSALENVTVTVGAAITGTVTVSNFPASQAVTFSAVTISNFPSTQPVSLATVPTHGVTLTSTTVTVSSLPALAAGTAQIGSVTASNITGLNNSVGTDGNTPTSTNFIKIGGHQDGSNSVEHIVHVSAGGSMKVDASDSTVTFGAIRGTVTIGNSVTIGSLPAISGTVTANVPFFNFGEGISDGAGNLPIYGIQIGYADSISGEFQLVADNKPIPISGTVTANSSNGSLTTRFGSVTTANTAFATSAVTNANRKYLLIQNITTASNVITVGIGFTPTTTQGIQLFAGAGLTFEGSYIPTGAVNLLSSVTASCYTILEA